MDGLTISNAENLIRTGQTSSQREAAELKSQSGSSTPSASFADTLKDAVNETNRLQKVADQKMEDLATGRAKSLPDVMVATERADIALKLMVQVRNKIIDAYQEIMKMQV
ncbi:MAG: flagellar hook-basal body complex protein FliE, partial [Bdellovibrionales bacterium]|nr:flagellar hook-basal body complex protein FliE [Bdellovibrionales bacterium]